MKPETGVAVIVDGEVVAWFPQFDDSITDWCTENYFGRWLTCKAECPVLIPITEEQFQQAALDAAEMAKIFDGKPA
ncbi:MAG: hypothetical protein IPK48_07795 [Gammaproteobacteria bacterium]|nr:hypothetical protein [Gammaproteobacteria bacterium]